jgi:methylenetetrahydrofolate dehydrogenase (NADP+) / methenyltetrahydrofolate cyclohydrolase
MTAYIIDGKKISDSCNKRTRSLAEEFLQKTLRKPSLMLVQVGEDENSKKYLLKKKKLGESLGLSVELTIYPKDISQDQLCASISEYVISPDIDGILVQQPLPSHLSKSYILGSIPPDKEVDGIHPEHIGNLLSYRFNREGTFSGEYPDGLYRELLPCTPAGVLHLIRHARKHLTGSNELSGLSALVIGRSSLVGAPLSLLLQASDVTVSIAHSKSDFSYVRSLAKGVDIIVSAAGVPSLVVSEMVREGGIVIDVGNTYKENGTIEGDVEFDTVKNIAGAITPVPGGVGPMTLAMLMRNVVMCAENNYTKKSGK